MAYQYNSPMGYLLSVNNPFAAAAAKQRGQVFSNGIAFDSDQATADDFFNKLGVHHPTGAAQPKPINPGMRLNQGEYVVTGGNGGQSDWANYDPSDGTNQYTKIANYSGGMIWKRQPQAPPPPPKAEAPAAAAPDPALDTKRIADAKARASAYSAGANPSYNASTPSPASGGSSYAKAASNPYQSAADYGKAANDYFSSVTKAFEGQADLQANEIGAATDYYTKKFIGKVPNLKDPLEWYRSLKGDIQSA